MVTTWVRLVSDSHLSRRTPEAVANWDAVVDDTAANPPDLVVHTGDISLDGPARPEDLRLARDQLGRISGRVAALPGNHDIGDNPLVELTERGDPTGDAGDVGPAGHAKQVVTPGLLAAYRSELGHDRWLISVPGWRLVGLNALLFGSGLDDEAGQWRWLASVLSPAAVLPRSISLALFLHKPLLPLPGTDDDAPGRYVPREARLLLLDMLEAWPTCVVVSGHVHQYSLHRHPQRPEVTHLWVPSTWAVIPDRFQPRLGDKVCGLVDLQLHDGGNHQVELREPPGLIQQAVSDDIPDPYTRWPNMSPE